MPNEVPKWKYKRLIQPKKWHCGAVKGGVEHGGVCCAIQCDLMGKCCSDSREDDFYDTFRSSTSKTRVAPLGIWPGTP